MGASSNTINSKVNPSFIQSIMNFITNYSFLTIIMLFCGMVFLSVVVTILYNNIPNSSQNTSIFDGIYIIVFTLIFSIIIFQFMGAETIILGKKFDLGLGIYIGIIFFISFVMGG
jgi:hypothetical protein